MTSDDDSYSQGGSWDDITRYRPPEYWIEGVVKWRTPELDLHGHYFSEVPDHQLTVLPDSIGNLRT